MKNLKTLMMVIVVIILTTDAAKANSNTTQLSSSGSATVICQNFVASSKYCGCNSSILHQSTSYSCLFGTTEPVHIFTGACSVCNGGSGGGGSGGGGSGGGGSGGGCTGSGCGGGTCTGSGCFVSQCTGSDCPTQQYCTGNNCPTTQEWTCDLGAYGDALVSHPEGQYNAGAETAGFTSVQNQLIQHFINSNTYANFTVNLLNSNWYANVLYANGSPTPPSGDTIDTPAHPVTSVGGGIWDGHFNVAMPGSTTPSVRVDWQSEFCGDGCGGQGADEINANVTPEAGCTGDCPLVTASYTSSVSVDDAANQVTNQIKSWATTYSSLPIQGWTNKVINPLTTSGTGYLPLAVTQMKDDIAKGQNSIILNGACSAGSTCTDNSSAVAYTSATYGNYLITLTKSNTAAGGIAKYTLSVSQNMCWDSANNKILLK